LQQRFLAGASSLHPCLEYSLLAAACSKPTQPFCPINSASLLLYVTCMMLSF
jgi:hypothetical protein